ncbi:MAG: phage Gp19/Gp15/Gp42 family protein [Eubacterium sp.]|nr:phage Gp19/Gp15/Gp42 family protein [Eubacterium sp.]MBQ4458026.1 phage Gp19/Gp15/Gp42 family protein [Clostridia bacterium]
MANYATIEDVAQLWRTMSSDEEARAGALLPIVSDALRIEADKAGEDLDAMLENNEALQNVAKSVTVDIVARVLMTSTNREPTTQYSESALGYSVSGTYLVPGGGLFIKKSELARLGLKKQRLRMVDLWDTSEE